MTYGDNRYKRKSERERIIADGGVDTWVPEHDYEHVVVDAPADVELVIHPSGLSEATRRKWVGPTCHVARLHIHKPMYRASHYGDLIEILPAYAPHDRTPYAILAIGNYKAESVGFSLDLYLAFSPGNAADMLSAQLPITNPRLTCAAQRALVKEVPTPGAIWTSEPH